MTEPTERPLTAASDNVHMWRLGEINTLAAKDTRSGDYIDRGLILLKILNDAGYDVVPRGRLFALPPLPREPGIRLMEE